MKILFLIGALGTGGAARQFMELTQRIGIYDVDPVICTLNPNMYDFEEYYRKNGTPLYCFRRRLFLDPGLIFRIADLCRTEKIDIIQTWQPLAGLYGLLAAKIAQKPIVCSTIRDAKTKSTFLESINKKLQAVFSDAFISNSRQGLLNQFSTWKSNFKVIPNGINLERFSNIDQVKVNALKEQYACLNA